ncbi:hypothetical protein E2562_031363 [Oryza meyeriana var. granulata]|uniref:Protein kinase domain-containing protein n=1 Tax=Oryza meyeriana var. granulata TaxID=110450 RepID=A0A6G1DRN3_9ORYZ|nr:hypothetical protein E2562_031363 [Oryza meyeriana var. granulata]
MATATLGFHAGRILLFSVLYVTASHANYSPVVVGNHHFNLTVSAGHGICLRTRSTACIPRVASSAATACAVEEDEEDRMLLLEDTARHLLRSIPNGNRGVNYTVLHVAERPYLAVNFFVDSARTGLSNSSPLSAFVVLRMPVNSSISTYLLTGFHDRIRRSVTLPDGKESYKIRRLLPDSNGPIAPTKQRHVAIHRQVRGTRRLRASVAVGGSALLGLICVVAAGVLLCCIRRKLRLRQGAAMAVELEELEDDAPILKPEQYRGLTMWPRRFLYSEMAAATRNFADDTKIGRGGFGPVYRGYLNDEGRHVAIKVLTVIAGEQSQQGLRQFLAEVTVMSQLRHRNIVQLVGWCDCRRGLLLVYELMPEGSLDKHLYDADRLLTWPDRYNIALGLGSALQYLHQDCDRCVVHGDIKPANVMLDASRNAKLGDFGLARLVDHGAELRPTQVVAGTLGYIDPEFVNSRRPSAESDVYSFGVVLLEIACGRRPAPLRRQDGAPAPLVNFVRGMYDRGTVLDAADGRLNGEFDEQQMERVLVTGLWCACHDATRRPTVAQAVEALRPEGAELPVPTPATRCLVGRGYGSHDLGGPRLLSALSPCRRAAKSNVVAKL